MGVMDQESAESTEEVTGSEIGESGIEKLV